MNQPTERFLRRSSLSCALVALLLSACTSVPPESSSAAAPVLLWPNGAPGATGLTDADKPALIPFLPTKGNTGAAMVIVPSESGGQSLVSGEAVEMARWLSERGIAGFVLRRRGAPYDSAASVADVNRAVQYLRANAADFKVSGKRVALLGFAGGAELVADAVYAHGLEAKANAADPVEKVSSRPDYLGLVWGAKLPATVPAGAPPTFLVGSASTTDGMAVTYDLWEKLTAARVPVDIHLFAKADAKVGLAADYLSLGAWPEMFYRWARFNGWMTEEPRMPVKGMVYLDGRPLPHGYVIFTPLDAIGAGPIVGRVLNSTAGQPLGLFTIPTDQGPITGRYKVDVRQNMNRWISNSFTANLVGGRGPATPEKTYYGHHRVLSPSIDDQHSFTKKHPNDKEDYVVEFKPGTETSTNLNIEVFSK